MNICLKHSDDKAMTKESDDSPGMLDVHLYRIRYDIVNQLDWEFNEGHSCKYVTCSNNLDMKSSTINVKVLDAAHEAILNSGAETSLCSHELWKSVSSLISHLKLTVATNVTLIDYTGTRRKGVLGSCVRITIRTLTLLQSMYVVKGLNYPMLLGKDFLFVTVFVRL